jgi:hypothetical protein
VPHKRLVFYGYLDVSWYLNLLYARVFCIV